MSERYLRDMVSLTLLSLKMLQNSASLILSWVISHYSFCYGLQLYWFYSTCHLYVMTLVFLAYLPYILILSYRHFHRSTRVNWSSHQGELIMSQT